MASASEIAFPEGPTSPSSLDLLQFKQIDYYLLKEFEGILENAHRIYANNDQNVVKLSPTHHCNLIVSKQIGESEQPRNYIPFTTSAYEWGSLDLQRNVVTWDEKMDRTRFFEDVDAEDEKREPFYKKFYNMLYKIALSAYHKDNMKKSYNYLYNPRKLRFNEVGSSGYSKIIIDIDEKIKSHIENLGLYPKTRDELLGDMLGVFEILYQYLSITNPKDVHKNRDIDWIISQNHSKCRNYHIVINLFMKTDHIAYNLIGQRLLGHLPKLDMNVWKKRTIRTNYFYNHECSNYYVPIFKGTWNRRDGLENIQEIRGKELPIESDFYKSLILYSDPSSVIVDKSELSTDELIKALNPPPEVARSLIEDDESTVEADEMDIEINPDNGVRDLIDIANDNDMKEFEKINKSFFTFLKSKDEEEDNFSLLSEKVFGPKERKSWLKSIFMPTGAARMNFLQKLERKLPKLTIKEFNKHFAFMEAKNTVYRRTYDEFDSIQWEEISTFNFKVMIIII